MWCDFVSPGPPSAGSASAGRGSRPFRGRWGSHKMTPEKPKRALWVDHGLKPRPQFHEEMKERNVRRKKNASGSISRATLFHSSARHGSIHCPKFDPVTRAHATSSFHPATGVCESHSSVSIKCDGLLFRDLLDT